jgi:hypothetical protein
MANAKLSPAQEKVLTRLRGGRGGSGYGDGSGAGIHWGTLRVLANRGLVLLGRIYTGRENRWGVPISLPWAISADEEHPRYGFEFRDEEDRETNATAIATAKVELTERVRAHRVEAGRAVGEEWKANFARLMDSRGHRWAEEGFESHLQQLRFEEAIAGARALS